MKLHATGRDLLIKESERLISGSVNMYTCEFTFDESWDGYSVTAVFSTNGSRLVNMAVVDGKCMIPNEVLRPNARIRIGIFGVDGVRSRPTTYSEWITVEQGTDVTGNAAQPPTPSVYEQWMSALDAKNDEWEENETARQEAEAARVEAEKERQDLESGYVAQAKASAEAAAESAAKAAEIAGGEFATETDLKSAIGTHNADKDAHADIRQEVASAAGTAATAQSTADNAATAATAAQSAADAAQSTADSKAEKPSFITATMTTSGWVDGAYSFEAEYPYDQYDISIEVAPTATAEQFEAFGGAMICGSATTNIATALSDIPSVDIPIIIKVVRR